MEQWKRIIDYPNYELCLLIPYVNVIALIIIVCYVIIALIILGVTLTKEKLNNWLFKNETNS